MRVTRGVGDGCSLSELCTECRAGCDCSHILFHESADDDDELAMVLRMMPTPSRAKWS